MYNVILNGRNTASESSYANAVTAAKSGVSIALANVGERANAILTNKRLYRSPKARRNVAAALVRSAANASQVAFPRKAGNVSLNVGGVAVSILKA